MGLDVVAYSKLVAVPELKKEQEAYDRGIVWIFVSNDFPEHREGLKGAYRFGDSMHFRAGSYSGYNHWRQQLAGLTGRIPEDIWKECGCTVPPPGKDFVKGTGPFYELIAFSDCEGIIGPKTSAKLYQDFKQYEARAKAQDPYFYEVYEKFMKGFEMAADGGFMKFC